MSEPLQIFSGQCCLCDIGTPVGHDDAYGRPLHTGDIVMVQNGDYIGTNMETWTPTASITAVVSDQYQSYSDGSIVENDDSEPYVMGIKSCGFDAPDWRVFRLKQYSDVVDGEHWTDWGFRYGRKEES